MISATGFADVVGSEVDAARPPCPLTIEETGLPRSAIVDLTLKALYQTGSMTGEELSDFLALAFPVLDDLLLSLQQRHFVEVLDTRGHGRSGYRFALTDEGRKRARHAMEASLYVGPAPVNLDTFTEWVRRQTVRNVRIGHEALRRAFADLVFPEEVYEALGPAVNSGSSIFLHGAPGNGKTAIAERLAVLESESIYLPRAVTVSGSVMVIEDPVYHHRVDAVESSETSPLLRPGVSWDRRFMHVRRPAVFVGGELTLDQLDLQYDPFSKVYQAPFQIKAAGGVLVIDDFGRQRARPSELLNRWIVPIEKGVDTLTLHTGAKFPVPFDTLLIFATNLNPSNLVDEAFLRRIQFKIEVRSPDKAAFAEILEMVCHDEEVPYAPAAVDLLFDTYYEPMGFRPRGCHPRDLVHQIQSFSRYKGESARLTPELIHRAARSYFLVTEEEYTAGIPSIHAT
ncbi:MAG: ATP-binding protein [Gemmatimonadetes bacterium]|nr:ATP-binding protein [Gemmatimonadota bacterium]